MTDVTLTIRRLGALDGRSPCAPPMRWRHPRKPMARIYRRRGAATFVNAARDRVDCEHGGIRCKNVSRFSTGTRRAAFHDDLKAFRVVVFVD